MDKRTYLKVKIKSLAAEAKIIRKEEKRARRHSIRVGLEQHRKGIVRTVARHTHLAYGFIRGRTRQQVEHKCKIEPSWGKVKTMVQKYGADYVPHKETWGDYNRRRKELMKRFDDWVSGVVVAS